jgi:hypothetical protein
MAKITKSKHEKGSFTKFYIRQFKSLFWMLLAVVIGLSLRESWAWLKAAIDLSTMALISGLVGIVIPNLAQFGSAGKVITKANNNRVNFLVGAGITLLALLVFNLIVRIALK